MYSKHSIVKYELRVIILRFLSSVAPKRRSYKLKDTEKVYSAFV